MLVNQCKEGQIHCSVLELTWDKKRREEEIDENAQSMQRIL